MVEEMSFIEEKSFEVFCKINNKNYKREEVSFEITPLSGISNYIYRVQIFHKNKEESFEIPNVFFKIFGKISSLVNREYETVINNSLAEIGYSAKIYDTDNKTYRVDEFLYGFDTLTPSCLYKEEVLSKMITILAYYNTIMDVNTYAPIMSIYDKRQYFNILLNDQTNYNCIAYLVRLFKPLAIESFNKFKLDVEADKESITQEFRENLTILEKYIDNFDKLMYDFCPDKAIMVLSHNDSHCLNILANKHYSSIMLVDHEYGYFNFFGYDIINYILESMFCLSDDKFPFYQFLIKDFNFLNIDSTFDIYLRFLNYFKDKYGHLFTKYPNFDQLFEMACTKDYYWKVLGTNCLFILLFAILYFDYPSIKNKSGYDYFHYIVDRMKAFEFASKSISYDLNK
jgi:thiamine kinase-like enzyme